MNMSSKVKDKDHRHILNVLPPLVDITILAYRLAKYSVIKFQIELQQH
jgi:hypothetical protein